ncbi:MAG: 50S ribosomal protein L5 [Gammaproteobacteria bacterium]|nr:50S ribosomal protein L5 [Gammaproteobacteria bacterium]MDA7990536.1 50S ribosomal protein L5 [Gammaproteobacteria bacterium]MDA8007502.1 50S ribosomal protein L5 [Gammaproteobacteria bacterium]MDA8010791.1 50S ribosomal protein L5 [Gammaproteobacteria bacterium]MDA8022507.1 50S ribosomal protein L5 [Gammaproteobacteria bacterium]
MARLKKQFDEVIEPALREQLGLRSRMQTPRLTKITLNMGLGEAVANKNVLKTAGGDLERISGQKPVITKAKKSEAAFKIRQGWQVGAKVTLRRERMYEFFDRLINVAIPRIRDFRGLPERSFDGRGNYSFGIKEQIVFPEIDYDNVDALRGLDVCITTTARDDAQALALLRAFQFPVRG